MEKLILPVGSDTPELGNNPKPDGDPAKITPPGTDPVDTNPTPDNGNDPIDPNPDTDGGDILNEGDIIEIDGTSLTIDKDGNAIDDKGTVVKTKADLASLSAATDDNTDDLSDWEDVRAEINYLPLDEQGKPIEYTKDKAGLIRYVMDTANQLAAKKQQEYLDNFFNENKDLHKAYIHKLKTGSIEGFQVDLNWEDFDIANAAENELESLFTAYRKALGDDAETISELLTSAKTNKTLAKKAEVAKQYFVDKQTSDQKAANDAIAAKQKAEKEANDKYVKSVQDTITTGKVVIGNSEFTIPEVIRVQKDGVVKQYSRNDFVNYLFTPKTFTVNNQKVQATQYQYDQYVESTKRNHNHDVLDAFKTFVGGDISQLIQRAVNDAKHKEVKRRFVTGNKQTPGNTGNKIKLPIS